MVGLGRSSEDHKLADTGDYNLFRYCHNDPVDFTDPMGLEDHREPWFTHHQQAIDEDRAYGEIMADAQWRNSGAINAGMTGYQVWEKGL